MQVRCVERRGRAGQEVPVRRPIAGFCYVILFAFDEPQKLQKKDFSGYMSPATLCLRLNRSPGQVIVFPGFFRFLLRRYVAGLQTQAYHFRRQLFGSPARTQFIRIDLCVLALIHMY
jgi:hypothetical protein